MVDASLPQEFDNDQVMRPEYRMEHADHGGEECCHLHLQTFVRVDGRPGVWNGRPPSAWPRIATIRADRLTFMPVFTNPHAQRYLTPKHGRIRTVTYVDGETQPLPTDAHQAIRQTEIRLPWELFADADHGFGLDKVLDDVWQVLVGTTHASALVVAEVGESRLEGSEVVVRKSDLDALRRSMNRIDRRRRDGIKGAKRDAVFVGLLTKLDPERFVNAGASTPAPAIALPTVVPGQRPSPQQRSAARASVAAIGPHLAALAYDSSSVLIELRSEIERVTLAEMIVRFEALLAQGLTEARWQSFFEANLFVLSLVFARPVQLLSTQFHARLSSLQGTGAQIGDFLFGELGQGLAIVEIKRPSTELVRGRPYRNDQVFAPSDELSGAVTQTLFQQSHLRTLWLVHSHQTDMGRARPDSIKCVVVAGTLPTEEPQLRSFEVFRGACKDVEIVTYDELLEKLRGVLRHLTPASTPPAAEATSHQGATARG